MLARRGLRVHVFERRHDLRAHAISAGRSINLAVSTRGLHALHQVELDEEVLAQAVPMYGRTMHSPKGELSFLRYGRDDSEYINSMSRGELNKLLLSRAEETGLVRFSFRQRLVAYDLSRQMLELRDEDTGEVRRVEAPLVIGSDGSASALRLSLRAASDSSITEDVLDFGYRELTMPPSAAGAGHGPGRHFAFEPNALHIWPRGRYMLIALPNRDGSFTCTLFLPFEAPDGEPCFARLREPAQVRAFFEGQFGDAVPHLPGLEEQFLAAPLGQMVTVKAWPWSRGSALLIGDAAHAIVPFFGQGMNAGFEDCTVLDALLGAELRSAPGADGIDWAQLFARFAQARKENTDAIADLAVENFVEMRDKVADPEFLLWKAVESELQRRFGARYLTRYQLVTFHRVPYRLALEAGKVQAALLRELCASARSPAEVDYSRAEALIEQRLAPLLAAAAGLRPPAALDAEPGRAAKPPPG
jgi:kynurenine 3-monooxygenase